MTIFEVLQNSVDLMMSFSDIQTRIQRISKVCFGWDFESA